MLADKVLKLEILAEIVSRESATGKTGVLSIIGPDDGKIKIYKPEEREKFENDLKDLPLGGGGYSMREMRLTMGGFSCVPGGTGCLAINMTSKDNSEGTGYVIGARFLTREQIAAIAEREGYRAMFASCERGGAWASRPSSKIGMRLVALRSKEVRMADVPRSR